MPHSNVPQYTPVTEWRIMFPATNLDLHSLELAAPDDGRVVDEPDAEVDHRVIGAGSLPSDRPDGIGAKRWWEPATKRAMPCRTSLYCRFASSCWMEEMFFSCIVTASWNGLTRS